MWCEYLYVILAYADMLKKGEKRFEIYIPAIIAITSFIYSLISCNYIVQFDFIKEIIPFIETLLGFTLAALTLLLSNNRIEEKNEKLPYGKRN